MLSGIDLNFKFGCVLMMELSSDCREILEFLKVSGCNCFMQLPNRFCSMQFLNLSNCLQDNFKIVEINFLKMASRRSLQSVR